ncbi:MAG: mannose-1-phosphate guanylyltransferase [Proteobacteria bacterium]|nr:MAG: mannose-1-phosphate guanylyltransferase [Pseudomonadota bacterium]
MKAMILAAGLGERMRPLTLTTPKPLLQAGNRTLIEYHLANLVAAGITDIVINVSWLADKIISCLGNGASFGVDIEYSRETSPLETAGGIRQALPMLTDSTHTEFVVINGDIWTDFPLSGLHSLVNGNAGHIVLTTNPAHNQKGDFYLAESGQISNHPPTPAPACSHTFSGISVLDKQIFELAPANENRLGILLRLAADQGKVSGEIMSGQWYDIGTPDRLDDLHRRLLHSHTRSGNR